MQLKEMFILLKSCGNGDFIPISSNRTTPNITQARMPEQFSALMKNICRKAYVVYFHFNESNTNTTSNKIKKIFKNKIQQVQ